MRLASSGKLSTGKRPKKKVSDKTERKRLISELDQLISQVCKKRWGGRCGICGGPGSQAHHYFSRKSYGSVRWDMENLIWLCFSCHIRRVHQGGDVELARDAIIHKLGVDGFDRLKVRANKVCKITVLDLIKIRESLLNERRGMNNEHQSSPDGAQEGQD